MHNKCYLLLYFRNLCSGDNKGNDDIKIFYYGFLQPGDLGLNRPYAGLWENVVLSLTSRNDRGDKDNNS